MKLGRRHESFDPTTHGRQDPGPTAPSVLDVQAITNVAATLPSPSFSPSPPQLYRNIPLPETPGVIRFLDLEAPTRNRRGNVIDTGLAGRLRLANLDDSPSRAISCLQEVPTLEITENCHAALRQVQRRFGAVTIWVDSICINQNDDEEKTRQIPLMRDIYIKATTVYIWFGEGTESSDRAMAHLSQCGVLFDRWPVSLLATTTKESWDMEWNKPSDRKLP